METLDFGVCRLSVVPVRKDPADQSEQVTQLLFGEDYEVLEVKDKKWLRIRINFDQYEGWIDARQHHSISKDYFDYISRAEFKITTDLTSSLLYNKIPLAILIGSIIPISSAELFKMEEQFAFNGESKNLGLKRELEFLKVTAQKYLNAPYQWGGKSPFGIDCSGFVQMVFKICGYKLQRDASQQVHQGRTVNDLDEAQSGDIAFFKNTEGKIIHTGIIIGENKIIHASGRVRIDALNEQGILNLETKIYTHELAAIRRILA
jgi:hypothetical protein